MLTAVEIATKRLTAVTVKVNGHGPEILQGGGAPLDSLEPAAVKAALAACGVAATKAVLVIPRGQSMIRDLELPDATPDELVAMVRFQVERELPLGLDQVRYSFIETGRADGKVRVQVAAVPREVIDPAIQALEGAGLKVAGAYVSTFGLLALHLAAGPAALVEAGGGEAEILVADAGRVEFSRTASLEGGADPQTLAEEVQRSLLSYAAKFPGRAVARVVLAGVGEEADRLASAIRSRLSLEVVQAGPGTLETAPIAGVCTGLLGNRPLPDLLNPPVARRRYRPTRMHRLGALAAGILLLLFVGAQVALADKRADLAAKRKELAELTPRVASATRAQDQTRLGGQWLKDRNVWLELLGWLRQAVNPATLWIVSASFDDAGDVRLQGKAKSDRNVTDFVTSLQKTGRFTEIQIASINPAEKGEYRQDFSVRARLSGYDVKKKK
jgi:Tfp pilus assembly protein PilN